jgi:hypothetical protein
MKIREGQAFHLSLAHIRKQEKAMRELYRLQRIKENIDMGFVSTSDIQEYNLKIEDAWLEIKKLLVI